MTDSIAVFYLHRHTNPDRLLLRFVNSAMGNTTSIVYTPYIINKGFSDRSRGDYYKSWTTAAGTPARNIYVTDDGTDIDAYFKVSGECRETYSLFFNSYSKILSREWLEFYVKALERLGPNAAVSATGSYERNESLEVFSSQDHPWEWAHIRTNAFMIPTALLRGMRRELPTKLDALAFESGPTSMSQQILDSGGRLAVIGRNGVSYAPQDWPASNTFRRCAQENLLVSDNRTRSFEVAKFKKKQHLSLRSWGTDQMKVDRDPPFKRMKNWAIRKLFRY